MLVIRYFISASIQYFEALPLLCRNAKKILAPCHRQLDALRA